MRDAVHLLEAWAAGRSRGQEEPATKIAELVATALADDTAMRQLLAEAEDNAVTERTRLRAQLALEDEAERNPAFGRALRAALGDDAFVAPAYIGAHDVAVVDDDVDVVQRLFFGRDDAEHDMADGLLRQGFLRTTAYSEVVSGRKTLIIGRKGSGKSAICMHLAENDGGTAVVITPDDAAGDELRRFVLDGLTTASAKALLWRYVFAVQTARYLVRHASGDAHRRTPSSVGTLERFLRDNGELSEESLYHRVVRAGRGLMSSFSLEAFGVAVAVERNGAPDGVSASRQLDVVEAGVRKAFHDLGCAGDHGPLLVMVDQLEQVWSDEPDTEALVIGLLLAGKHAALTYGGALRCVFFLRSDIYDTLDFSDADKFHSDEIRLSWTVGLLHDLTLVRAGVSLGRRLLPHELWGEVFPETVAGQPTADYLFARTLPRPRDAIQFLNQCRDTAVSNGHRRISERDVLDATLVFSRWKLLDLAKEYSVRYPFLGALLTVFRDAGHEQTRTSIAELFQPFQEALQSRYEDYAPFFDPDVIIELLFSVGFLGVSREDRYVYWGTTETPVLPYESEFCVHPCFRPALGATRPVNPTVTNNFTGSVVGRVVQANTIRGDIVYGSFSNTDPVFRRWWQRKKKP